LLALERWDLHEADPGVPQHVEEGFFGGLFEGERFPAGDVDVFGGVGRAPHAQAIEEDPVGVRANQHPTRHEDAVVGQTGPFAGPTYCSGGRIAMNARSLVFSLLLGLSACGLSACGTDSNETDKHPSALTASGLDDGTVEADAELGACAPDDPKRTTICHVSPGNPADAHTLCIDNAAVEGHLKNHSDSLGPCEV
jgi:hypothetical protein